MEILDQADALRKKRAEADAKASRILFALFYKCFGNPLINPMAWEEVTLDKLPSLRRLRLVGCLGIPWEQIERFKKAHPQCDVEA